MAEIERKEVVITTAAQSDIKAVFEFGTETFGFIYRITRERVEVLRVFNSRVSIRKIRGVRGTKV